MDNSGLLNTSVLQRASSRACACSYSAWMLWASQAAIQAVRIAVLLWLWLDSKCGELGQQVIPSLLPSFKTSPLPARSIPGCHASIRWQVSDGQMHRGASRIAGSHLTPHVFSAAQIQSEFAWTVTPCEAGCAMWYDGKQG